jgi:NAD+ synthase
MQQLSSRLVDWLKHKAREARAKGVVVGMSGGIDSSVVAVLCKQAFPDGVLGLLIPCHSIAEDMEHARLVADKFGVHTETVSIFANRLGYLVVGSSNRCEVSVGYFSKYGDGGVDIMPLGNLVKSQVRDLARHLGVPQVIIDKPPSAGLWAGQTDEQEMGLTYDQLDAYFTTGKAPEAVRRKIEERIARNAHKRATPPIPPF